MRLAHLLICMIFGFTPAVWGQKPVHLQTRDFFETDSLLQVRLTTDFTTLQRHRTSDSFYVGTIEIVQQKHSILQEKVLVRNRGKMRRETCFPPPIMIDFKAINDSGSLKKLGKLKLVSSCSDDDYSNQLLIREYLVYKIYELFTPLSFRTRIINISYEDDNKENFSKPRYAFLLEDVDDMAKRNGYRETESRFSTPLTDRKAATVFFIFQYMIGNTDWAIPLNRNLKMVYRKEIPNSAPVPVPYDFDYAGLVNASYASPSEILPITNVRERYYMGFERSKEEIIDALVIFRKNKMAIYETIEACQYLASDGKKDMINYLESFFRMIEKWDDVVEAFITNARKS
jgi:hypothetical protein